MPNSLHRRFPLLSNVHADPRLMGFPAFLNPHASKTSSPRANMYASHNAQAMIIDGCEHPQQFTGAEYGLGLMEYSTTRRTQDAEIIAVIHKFIPTTAPMLDGRQGITFNPQVLVIYLGMEDKRIHYFTLDRYFRGTDGFGYQNKWLNTNRLYNKAGDAGSVHLPKDVPLVTSPAHDGNKYCQGTNLNVVYMSMMDTIDDAMLVSVSGAEKLGTTEVAQQIIPIRQDSRPVNLYGRRPEEMKWFPDIGEYVGPHGYFCATRPMQTETYAADLDPQALMHPQETDEIISFKPGARIIDIDFAFNPAQKKFGAFGAQMDAYIQASRQFYGKILETYYAYKDRYQLSQSFSTLVHTAAKHMLMINPDPGRQMPDLQLKSKRFDVEGLVRRQPVDFIQMVVTYTLPRPVNKAFKITDRHGHKGVMCRICPDEEMPVDQNGVRADVVIDPTSPNARMNFGTLMEPAINRISEFVQRECKRLLDTDQPQAACEALLSWYDDVNPNYGIVVRRSCPTPERMLTHVRESVASRISLWIPPFLDTVDGAQGMENLITWTDKWNAHATPVTYSLHDRHGVKRTYTTREPMLIGAKYIYCLAKLPYPTSAGISHISHYGLPIKASGSVRNRFPTRLTAIKAGEDEHRLMTMDVAEEEVVRLDNLYSNSTKGIELQVRTLLNEEYPTRIHRMAITNEELARTSAVTAIYHHTTSVLGIQTRDTLTTLEAPAGLRNDSAILGVSDARLGSGFSDGAEGVSSQDEKWLDALAEEVEALNEALLGDLDTIDTEFDIAEVLGRTGAEPLLDTAPDPGDAGLAQTVEDPTTEDDIDPQHDPNIDD